VLAESLHPRRDVAAHPIEHLQVGLRVERWILDARNGQRGGGELVPRRVHRALELCGHFAHPGVQVQRKRHAGIVAG
jgi:hypothetical protein